MNNMMSDMKASKPVHDGVCQPERYRFSIAHVFSFLFQTIAILLIGYALFQFVSEITEEGNEFISAIVKGINTLVISLAMFELGAGVNKEYCSPTNEQNLFLNIRRTITRFVGTVCIALVLEALIMVIKYSQLDLAGNLYYPVSILIGSSLLLISLGGFLWLTCGHTE